MAYYYVYLLDRADRIKTKETYAAADDQEAVKQAERYLASHPAVAGLEVWLGSRRVKAVHQRT